MMHQDERPTPTTMQLCLADLRAQLHEATIPLTVLIEGPDDAVVAREYIETIQQRRDAVGPTVTRAVDITLDLDLKPWPEEWMGMETAMGTIAQMMVLRRVVDDTAEQVHFLIRCGFVEGSWFLASYCCRLCSLYLALAETQGNEWSLLNETSARA